MNQKVKHDLVSSIICAAIGILCMSAHPETNDFWATHGQDIADLVAIALQACGVCALVVAAVKLAPLIISGVRYLWRKITDKGKSIPVQTNQHTIECSQSKTNVSTQYLSTNSNTETGKPRLVQRGRVGRIINRFRGKGGRAA